MGNNEGYDRDDVLAGVTSAELRGLNEQLVGAIGAAIQAGDRCGKGLDRCPGVGGV